jgi:hypothetical protein
MRRPCKGAFEQAKAAQRRQHLAAVAARVAVDEQSAIGAARCRPAGG